MAAAQQAQDSAVDDKVPLESQTVVDENHIKDCNVSNAAVHVASSVKSPKGVQEEASFLGKGGEQQFVYHPIVYAPQPETFFSGGYFNHMGQLEEYPHTASMEGFNAVSPVMYGAYSHVSTIEDSQLYFPLHYPFSTPYYQLPASPSMGYSNSSTEIPQFDSMQDCYYLPDGLLYSPTPGFHQHYGFVDGAQMQPSGVSGYFGQGNIPPASGMHQGSIYSPGPYKARHQGGKFGGTTTNWGAASRRLSIFDKGFRHEKASPEFLNEQNHGPRATKPKREVDSSSTEDKNMKTTSVVDSELYNHPDFVTEYKDANFFVIKSYTEDHVHKSIKYGVWASTASGNKKLNAAYREGREREEYCPIFLFFSVNGSGQFCGVSEMIGPVNFEKSVNYWQQDKWSGQFPVKWHIVKDVPNNLLRHIILGNNDNKPVTNSRDTQEVRLDQGLQMLAIFKNHEAETTILEDFDFYEQREKAMLDNRQQQRQQCVDDKVQKLVETMAPVDLMTQITDNFAHSLQLEESQGNGKQPKVDDIVATENTSAALVKTEEAIANTEQSPLKESG